MRFVGVAGTEMFICVPSTGSHATLACYKTLAQHNPQVRSCDRMLNLLQRMLIHFSLISY
jgi:hypothetical protein